MRARHAVRKLDSRHAKCFLAYAARRPRLRLLIMCISFGIRAGFGLFLQPMSLEYGWGREVFSFSIALQNLMWGALGAVAGGFADRYGPGPRHRRRRDLLRPRPDRPGVHRHAVAAAPEQRRCCSAARSAAPRSASSSRSSAAPWRRSGAASTMGIATAAGSFGQFLLLPLTQVLIAALRLARRAARARRHRGADHSAHARAGRQARRRAAAQRSSRSARRCARRWARRASTCCSGATSCAASTSPC